MGGWEGEVGNLEVAILDASIMPNNDNFPGESIGSLPFDDSVDTLWATEETGEPAPCGRIASTVWYSFTPSENMVVVADTFGSSYDTVLAAYTGNDLTTLNLVACNDDASDQLSLIGFSATAEETYYFQVGGFAGGVGNLVLHVDASPPEADLLVSMADNPDPVVVGETITYEITVTNAGPSTAVKVAIKDILPAGVTFVSAEPAENCSESGGVVRCRLRALGPGSTATSTIVVMPTQAGTIANGAGVRSSETLDPDMTNNHATVTTEVVEPAAKILFQTERDGSKDIYVMDGVDSAGDREGDNQTQLAISAADDAHPSWSPEGGKIALGSDREGDYEIYAMDAVDADGDGNGESEGQEDAFGV